MNSWSDGKSNIVTKSIKLQIEFANNQYHRNIVIITQMKQQLIAISVINKALNLPEYTSLTDTLEHIHQLTAFRKQHQLCNNIIFTLRDQLAKLQLQITTQTNQYLTKKLQLAKQESERLFKFEQEGVTLESIKTKKYPKYESMQQFMNDQFQIKTNRCKQKHNRLKLTHDISHCFIPVTTVIEQNYHKQSQKQLQTMREQGLSVSDSV